jgi:hypothetical protein
LAENAQEFIFVHIPKKNMGDNPLQPKNIASHFTAILTCAAYFINASSFK